MTFVLPNGYRVSGIHCGIKRNPQKQDVALIVSDRDCTAAGVYTQNVIKAAPVQLNQEKTPSEKIRAVIVNSGNANACTGERGMKDARRMAEFTSACLGIKEDQVLVLSTGVIGEFLPMDRIESGIRSVSEQLADDEESLVACARGMMTTDTRHKTTFRELSIGGQRIGIRGLAKGAAMIGPNMATMLSVILTDAPLSAEAAQSCLGHAVRESFNCISVEGHMSTNDTVLMLANGESGSAPMTDRGFASFQDAVREVCVELARAIVNDGEGASHVITIDVTGCRTKEDAQDIARTVANSPLVKTAIAGGDPNWGRIVSAVGYAGVTFDSTQLALDLNGTRLYENNGPATFEAASVSQALRESRETSILIMLEEGEARARFWTTDLTTEYIRLNADYHT